MKQALLPVDEPERLRALRELRFADAAADPALAAIARLAGQCSGWPMAAVSLVDAGRQWCAAAVGLSVLETPRRSAFCSHAILSDRVFEVPDAGTDPRFGDNPLLHANPPVRAYAAAPVTVDGRRIGTVCVLSDHAGRLDAAALAALQDLAGVAGALLDERLGAQRAGLHAARVRGASRAGADWLWETDADSSITWVSDSAEAHTGESAEATVGDPAMNHYHRPQAAEHQASFDAFIGARQQRLPFRNAVAERDTPNGRITVAVSGDPVFDDDGDFLGYRGAVRDISDELALRTRAAQAERLLQATIEHLNAAVMVSGPDGRITLTNSLWRHRVVTDAGRMPQTWEQCVRDLVAAGAYPDAAGREEAFVSERLAMASDSGTPHEMTVAGRHVLVSDRRLPDGSVVHLLFDITAQKQAQRQLGEQQARLRAVLRSLPDLWFVLDGAGHYLECSDGAHPWLPQPYEQLHGRPMVDGLSADDQAPARAALQTALASGDVQRFDYTLQIADGSTRALEARISPMPDARLLCLVRDLTELRSLERELRLMQRAVEADAAMPITVADATQPQMPLVYVNTAFERLTGYARADVLGQNCRFLQGGDRDAAAYGRLKAALAEGRDCVVTVHNRRRNGELFLNELHIAPVWDAAGRLTHFIGMQHDVTERDSHAAQIARSEALYRSITAAIADGLLVLADDGRIVTANEAAALLLALPADAVCGRTLQAIGARLVAEDGSPLSPDDEPLRAALATGRATADRALRLVRHDGSTLLVCVNVQPLAGEGAGARSCVLSLRDITLQRRAEQALRDSQAAELVHEATNRFLSRMSHEMRTPLNAVIGFTQLLQLRGSHSAAELREFCDHVLEASRHLLALVNDVLDLQHAGTGRTALDLQRVALQPVLQAALSALQPLVTARRLTVVSSVTAEAPTVRADPQRLRRALDNVVSNAIKYNRDGGHVRCLVEADATTVTLVIEDTGPGLTEPQIARLFQPFERLGRETADTDGTGLGLVIAQALMQAMHGTLSLASPAGSGVVVRLGLPRDPPVAVPFTAAGAMRPDGPPARSLQVLYVEDNPVNALVFQEAVRLRPGIDLRIAEDAWQALDAVRGWRPDVLVLDAHLPQMSGHDLLRRLRAVPGLADTPAYMCSADAMPSDIQRALDAGFVGYWTKPIDIAMVLRELGQRQSGPRA